MNRLITLCIALSLAAQSARAEAPATATPPTPDTSKPAGHSAEFFRARYAALAARKEEQRERVRQHKVERAAAQEKAYQDWHDRYVADAPVREQYYRSEAASAEARAAYLYASTPVVVQVSQNVGLPSFGPTSFTNTASCSMSRSAFFGSSYHPINANLLGQ
jgi:hypothetical protein